MACTSPQRLQHELPARPPVSDCRRLDVSLEGRPTRLPSRGRSPEVESLEHRPGRKRSRSPSAEQRHRSSSRHPRPRPSPEERQRRGRQEENSHRSYRSNSRSSSPRRYDHKRRRDEKPDNEGVMTSASELSKTELRADEDISLHHSTSGEYDAASIYRYSIWLPSDRLVAYLIGKGGTTATEMRMQSKLRILSYTVEKRGPEGTLIGTREAIEEALLLIRRYLKRAQRRDIINVGHVDQWCAWNPGSLCLMKRNGGSESKQGERSSRQRSTVDENVALVAPRSPPPAVPSAEELSSPRLPPDREVTPWSTREQSSGIAPPKDAPPPTPSEDKPKWRPIPPAEPDNEEPLQRAVEHQPSKLYADRLEKSPAPHLPSAMRREGVPTGPKNAFGRHPALAPQQQYIAQPAPSVRRPPRFQISFPTQIVPDQSHSTVSYAEDVKVTLPIPNVKAVLSRLIGLNGCYIKSIGSATGLYCFVDFAHGGPSFCTRGSLPAVQSAVDQADQRVASVIPTWPNRHQRQAMGYGLQGDQLPTQPFVDTYHKTNPYAPVAYTSSSRGAWYESSTEELARERLPSEEYELPSCDERAPSLDTPLSPPLSLTDSIDYLSDYQGDVSPKRPESRHSSVAAPASASPDDSKQLQSRTHMETQLGTEDEEELDYSEDPIDFGLIDKALEPQVSAPPISPGLPATKLCGTTSLPIPVSKPVKQQESKASSSKVSTPPRHPPSLSSASRFFLDSEDENEEVESVLNSLSLAAKIFTYDSIEEDYLAMKKKKAAASVATQAMPSRLRPLRVLK